MSTDLPTEEDVLAVGLLCWFVYETEEGGHGVPSEWADDLPGAACAVWNARKDALGTIGAIADGERRLDCERAREDVLEEARRHARITRMLGTSRATATDQAVEDLERAETEVSRHGG